MDALRKFNIEASTVALLWRTSGVTGVDDGGGFSLRFFEA